MENLNTKTKLLNRVKELEQDKRETELGYEHDELYKAYKEQLAVINEQREKLRQEMGRLRQEHKREVKSELDFFEEEIGYLKSLANQSDGLNPDDYSMEVSRIFRVYYSGYQMPSNLTRLIWVSPCEQYVVMKRRGYSYGQGWTAGYVEVEYHLYHVDEPEYNVRMASKSLFSWRSNRWSKARLKEVQEAINKHRFEVLETK